MNKFDYARASDVPDAIKLSSLSYRAKYLSGGTNLVDLMRETVEAPTALVDVSSISTSIKEQDNGSLALKIPPWQKIR